MATKTISLSVEAYERLRKARLKPEESFSQVVLRTVPVEKAKTAAAFLAAMKVCPPLDPKSFERWAMVEKADLPPDDPWKT